MDEIKNAFSSPLWWLTTFVFSFLVNAFSPWLMGKLSSLTQRLGDKRRVEAEKRDADFARMVLDAKTDLRALIHVTALASHAHSLALRLLLFTAIMLGTGSLVLSFPPSTESMFGPWRESVTKSLALGAMLLGLVTMLMANIVVRRARMYDSALRQAQTSTARELAAKRIAQDASPNSNQLEAN